MADPKFLEEFISRVEEMRRLQKAYFAGDRSRESLVASKAAERFVDGLLEQIRSPQGQQGRLF